MLVGGSVFAIFAGIYYWFPKMTGRMLGESMGKWSFALMYIGFNVTFLIQHSIGLDGMPRRVYEYPDVGNLALYNLISTIGSFILAAGIGLTVDQRRALAEGRRQGRARSVEGATRSSGSSQSPPPVNNFDVIPRVRSVEPMKDIRRQVARQTGSPSSSELRLASRSGRVAWKPHAPTHRPSRCRPRPPPAACARSSPTTSS